MSRGDLCEWTQLEIWLSAPYIGLSLFSGSYGRDIPGVSIRSRGAGGAAAGTGGILVLPFLFFVAGGMRAVLIHVYGGAYSHPASFCAARLRPFLQPDGNAGFGLGRACGMSDVAGHSGAVLSAGALPGRRGRRSVFEDPLPLQQLCVFEGLPWL